MTASRAWEPFEVAVHVANDGESNWFEGVQLPAVYVVLAVAFFFV